MNPDWFGDSYDVVKRYFAEVIRALGYAVYVDPMPTGNWRHTEANFLKFLGAKHVRDHDTSMKSALLLDPDTGIGTRPSPRHTTVERVASRLKEHTLVFVFDQSFSRGTPSLSQLQEKLGCLHGLDVHGFYYDFHARFLFASRSNDRA